MLVSGCGDTFSDPDLTPEWCEPTLTIGEMLRFYDGENPLTFTENYRIGGVVTASDESGNFYRTFMVDDHTGGVEVMAGLYDLHTLYPVGRLVSINLRGLTLAQTSGGVFQLGFRSLPSSGYPVDYIGHSALLEKYVLRGGVNTEFQVPDPAVSDLDDSWLGRLVRIRGLELRGGGETTWATVEGRYPKDIRATDSADNWLYVYTSGYADFAGETIPVGRVDVTGVLMKNGKRYRLKLRDLGDVVPACTPK